MSDIGLPGIDRTVQETNEWLRDISAELKVESKQEAYHALRSVLFGLRNRLPTNDAAHLAAQLPMLIRGIYYEGYVPSEQPKTYRSRDGWEAEVAGYYDADESPDIERITTAVLNVMTSRLDQGVVQKTYSALPEGVRELWVEVPEDVAKQA